MDVVEIVGPGHILLVKSVIPGLVAADQEDRSTPRVKGVEDP
jgi:hypothetical protein